jgi:hypothetical protein
MKWIDVDHELPPANVKVLAYDTQRIYIAYMPNDIEYNEHWVVCVDQDCCKWGITSAVRYWMPLPRVPNDVD